MQRIDRSTWLGVVASIVVALALVSLIPFYDLAGGHAEHGMQTGTAALRPRIAYAAQPDGVVVQVLPVAGMSTVQVRQAGQNLLYQYQFGDFGDDGQGLSAQLAAQLTTERAQIEIDYRETGAGCEIVLTSGDQATVALLHDWMQASAREGKNEGLGLAMS